MKDELFGTFRTDAPSLSNLTNLDDGSAKTEFAGTRSPRISINSMSQLESNLDLSFRTSNSLVKQHKLLYRRNPQYLVLALFLFFVLTASGVSLAVVYGRGILDQEQQEALLVASETGDFFSSNLDEAILPLFSLAQFANELEIFRSLPAKVGMANEEGSLPFIPSMTEQGVPTHRNITGVCDDPALLSKFEKIAGDIKKNARMDGILVNLQLVPDAVVCLAHPINNTEDFPPGIYMDNSGAIGHDLLNDPARSFIARATVPAEDVVIAGPLTLKQCKDCDPVVEKGFIVRLPITSDTNAITVDNVAYNRWGFAVAIINWNELVYRSDVFAMFERETLEFQLTRTDRKYNPETSEYTEKVVILAESSNFASSHGREVTATLPTTNNEWEIAVKYCTEGCVEWYPWVIGTIVILSFCISIMIYLILSQQQLHSISLAEKQQQMVENSKLAAKKERELNDFIAHEVRNPLSAALSATSFVSASIYEKEPLLTEESRIAVREDVHIIESSLKFINDLLRSMLDLHRAKSNQLSLELSPTDIKRDILDPAASMLYQRDVMFSVEVHCPENMLVLVDSLRLKQIVLNLARNSCKFVEKGFVRMRAEFVEEGFAIYVEDSGPGIPVEKRSRLFAQFQDSLDSLAQGTGIGLSLCKKLIDLMGGTITLDEGYHSGLEGKPGAKLDIFVPCPRISVDVMSNKAVQMLTKSQVSGRFELEESESELPEELRALFVDDDVVLRKLFMRSLKRIRPKWTVMEAASGESALKLVETEKFDVIFLDQYMTSVEKQLLGTETARKMRLAGIESLICGLSANDMEEAFITAGADAFMMKPFPCKPVPLTKELSRILNHRDVKSPLEMKIGESDELSES